MARGGSTPTTTATGFTAVLGRNRNGTHLSATQLAEHQSAHQAAISEMTSLWIGKGRQLGWIDMPKREAEQLPEPSSDGWLHSAIGSRPAEFAAIRSLFQVDITERSLDARKYLSMVTVIRSATDWSSKAATVWCDYARRGSSVAVLLGEPYAEALVIELNRIGIRASYQRATR
jgi:hypothetical protein